MKKLEKLLKTTAFMLLTILCLSCDSGPSFCECFGTPKSMDAALNTALDTSLEKAEACREKFSDLTPRQMISRQGECQ